jgi:hypothetical protein
MKINLKKIIKAFLPHGVVILYEKHREFIKYCDKQNGEQELSFDIILSVGISCKVAYYLKKHGLRFCANPLDWMMSYSLDTVIHLYKTNFNDFFVEFSKDKQKSLEYNCHWFIDTKNNIVSQHYADLEKDNEAFREKIKSRFERLNQILIKAKRICFISCRNDNINILRNFLKRMGEMYYGEIIYINIRNYKESVSPIKHQKEISEKLTLVEYKFNDIHPKGDNLKTNGDAWIGNYIIWDKIMEKIVLKHKSNFFSYLFRSEA